MSLDDETPTEYFGPGAKLIHLPGKDRPIRVDPDYGQHLVERHEGAWLEDAPPITGLQFPADALTADGGWRVGPSPELIKAEAEHLKFERGGIKWPNGPVPHPEREHRATVHLKAALAHAQEQRDIHRQTIAVHEEAVTFLNDHIAHIQQRIREAEGR